VKKAAFLWVFLMTAPAWAASQEGISVYPASFFADARPATANDMITRSFAAAIDDAHSRLRVELERAVVMDLDGDCKSPIAALATIEGDNIRLRAAVGAVGGEPPIARAEAVAELNDPVAALHEVMRSLEEQGARELLTGRAPSGAWSLTRAH